jgi:hypothetical protein
MESLPAPSTFPDTRRTWIHRQLLAGESGLAAIQQRLMEIYAEPLRATACSRLRLTPEQALDLVHGFFVSRFTQAGYFDRWLASGRMLRHWLWNGLCFHLHEWRRDARKLPTVAELPDCIDGNAVDPGEELDRAFVATLVRAALRRAEEQCREEGFLVHWRIHARHAAGEPLAAVGREFGLSESEARVKVRAPQRRIVAAIRELLIDEGVPELELPRVIRELLAVVG